MFRQEIIELIRNKVGDGEFITPNQLVELRLFGSSAGVRHLIRKGILPHVRISERRILIPVTDLLKHIEERFTASIKERKEG